ncbi:MAG: cytochrome c biogenesis protein CcdA [Actinobacteria bacterium]|nr:cytochrome c biogenesis protein CcdA [Actinomycetota bacterium]
MILAAFLAGLLSFLSPCVLPLIPGYLSFISGVSVDALEEKRTRVIMASALFVLGFSVVFVAMGASASLVGGFLIGYRRLIERIAGVFIILFGLSLAGAIDLPFLFRSGMSAGNRRFGLAGALPLGMAFAVAWTPCVGAILASILLLAAQGETAGRGGILLASYAAGLGIPFLLAGAFFARARGVLQWFGRHKRIVSGAAGFFLIAMGLLMLSGQLTRLSFLAQRLILY